MHLVCRSPPPAETRWWRNDLALSDCVLHFPMFQCPRLQRKWSGTVWQRSPPFSYAPSSRSSHRKTNRYRLCSLAIPRSAIVGLGNIGTGPVCVAVPPCVCPSLHIPLWWLDGFSSCSVPWVHRYHGLLMHVKWNFGPVPNLHNYFLFFYFFCLCCDISKKNVLILFIFSTK